MIGIIGLGFVGGAILKSFKEKNINVFGYDKYKEGGIGTFKETLSSKMVFLCLPQRSTVDLFGIEQQLS